MAMAAALHPDVVASSQSLVAGVELAGTRTRGQVVVDWMAGEELPAGVSPPQANVTFITSIRLERVAAMLLDAVKQ